MLRCVQIDPGSGYLSCWGFLDVASTLFQLSKTWFRIQHSSMQIISGYQRRETRACNIRVCSSYQHTVGLCVIDMIKDVASWQHICPVERVAWIVVNVGKRCRIQGSQQTFRHHSEVVNSKSTFFFVASFSTVPSLVPLRELSVVES